MLSRILIILSLMICERTSIHAFELKRVILATNDHPHYIQFWPIVAPLWRAMGLVPTLAWIADKDCMIDTSLGDVIRVAPIPGVSGALQAQTIRLLLPALFPDDVCLISDIDMLPISQTYFMDGAKECPDDTFLVYRDQAYGRHYRRFPMCYIAAKGKVFASVFEISNLEEINATIANWASRGYGWNTDEKMLYIYLKCWESAGGSVTYLGHDVGPRIDRIDWPQALDALNITNYIDCHCPRPYLDYAESIDYIAQAILKQWKDL